MKINVIRLANSLDPKASFRKDGDAFLNEINNELFDKDFELVEDAEDEALYTVIFVETGGAEQHFVRIEKYLPRPIVLISDSLNNSLPACLEIKSFLANNNEDCILLFGQEKDIAGALAEVGKIAQADQAISGATLGVIGKPSDWLIASIVDYEQVQKLFNITLLDITSLELKTEIDKGLLDKMPKSVERFKKMGQDEEVLNGALAIYSGLKRIIQKYKLQGFTIRCFDLIEQYKNTACLALAMLNEEGIIATCEGDVPSMLSMYIIKAVTGNTSFQANPSKIEFSDQENGSSVILAHCTVPLNMARKYDFQTHFESGLGIGIHGKLYHGPVTIFKLGRDLKTHLLISGDLCENLQLPNYCRTQIRVKIEDEDLYQMINKSYGNHVIVCYGDHTSEISNVLHYYHERMSRK